MSGIDDVMSFWGEESTIAKKASRTNSVIKYDLPNIETGEGKNAFEQIGLYMIKMNSKKMESDGFIDLDDEWLNSEDSNVVNFRNQQVQVNEESDETIPLIDAYPTPYCGRKAYLVRISLDNATQTTDEGVITKKVMKRLKMLDNDRIMFSGRVCVFHNSNLGYNDKATHDSVMGTNEKGELNRKKDENSYQHRWLTFFGDLALGKNKLFNYVNEKIEVDPNRTNVPCFALTPFIKKKIKDDMELNDATSNDYWYSMNLDDAFLI